MYRLLYTDSILDGMLSDIHQKEYHFYTAINNIHRDTLISWLNEFIVYLNNIKTHILDIDQIAVGAKFLDIRKQDLRELSKIFVKHMSQHIDIKNINLQVLLFAIIDDVYKVPFPKVYKIKNGHILWNTKNTVISDGKNTHFLNTADITFSGEYLIAGKHKYYIDIMEDIVKNTTLVVKLKNAINESYEEMYVV